MKKRMMIVVGMAVALLAGAPVGAHHSGLTRRSISEKLRRYRIDKAEFKPHVARRRALAMGE